jgi:hypothetical protein
MVGLDPGCWSLVSWEGEDEPPRTPKAEGEEAQERRIRQYNAFQYFTEPARRLVLGTRQPHSSNAPSQRPVVQHFELRPNGRTLKELGCRYVIERGDHRYELDLVRVRLITYSTGVSMLVLETEYYGEHHTLEDIERINEHGRHVCFPWVNAKPDHGHHVTADYISIPGLPGFTERAAERATPDGRQPEERHVADFVYDRAGDDWWRENLSFHHLMDPLKAILSEWSDKRATSRLAHLLQRDRADSDGLAPEFLVRPAMDDRMFVCCLYRSDQASREASAWVDSEAASDRRGHYRLFSSEPSADRAADAFAAFAFVDADGSSCQSRTMRARVLQDCVYDRWIEYGTLYAATPHSFVCLTGEDWTQTVGPVVIAFTNVYIEMVLMALAQKASVLHMSGEAASLADGHDPNDPDEALVAAIAELQHRNARVQNQVVLSEVTTQIQGIELFSLLRRQLGIEASNAELVDQLDYLYKMSAASAEQARLRADRQRAEAEAERLERQGQMAFRVTLLALLLAVAALGSAVIDVGGAPAWLFRWGLLIPGAVVVAIGLWLGPWLWHHRPKSRTSASGPDRRAATREAVSSDRPASSLDSGSAMPTADTP